MVKTKVGSSPGETNDSTAYRFKVYMQGGGCFWLEQRTVQYADVSLGHLPP